MGISKSKRIQALAGAAGAMATATLFFSLAPLPERRATPSAVVPSTQARTPEPRAAVPHAPRAAPKVPAQPQSQSRTERAREEKARLARAGEAVRIASREGRLDALDWEAPRPKPQPDDGHAVGKTEAALAPAEKSRQTRRLVELIQARIERAESAVPSKASTASRIGLENDPMLLARMRERVTQLEEQVRVWSGPTQALQ